MLTVPLSDSYHTVWMRLHQELLLLLGSAARRTSGSRRRSSPAQKV